MLQCISHFKRLNTRIPPCDPIPPFVTRRVIRTRVVDEKTRSIKVKTELKTFDRVEEMRPYRVSDFSLNNMIALGVKMTPTHLSASPHKSVSDMASVLDSININSNDD